MSLEKSDAVVLRLADFSESSRVATLFTREFGKVAVLAKGAKRLKGPFEAALDLLSACRIVFICKSSTGLDLLTEAQLVHRFRPFPKNISSLHAGYYVAELLDGTLESYDPHPVLFAATLQVLESLATLPDYRLPLLRFELLLLRETGLLPNFDHCHVCGAPVGQVEVVDGQKEEVEAIEFKVDGQRADDNPICPSTINPKPSTSPAPPRGPRYWVSQGGLICSACGRPEYEHKALQFGTVHALRTLADDTQPLPEVATVSPTQFRELRRVLTASISQMLDQRPKMLAYLRFDTPQ